MCSLNIILGLIYCVYDSDGRKCFSIKEKKSFHSPIVPLQSKMCFSSLSYSRMFELRRVEWCMCRVWHSTAVFTPICWKSTFSLCSSKICFFFSFFFFRRHHKPIPLRCSACTKCNVEAWRLPVNIHWGWTWIINEGEVIGDIFIYLGKG